MGNTELNLKNLNYEEIQNKIKTIEELENILNKNNHINEIKNHSKFIFKILEKTLKKNEDKKILIGVKIINMISWEYPDFFWEKYFSNDYNIYFNFFFKNSNFNYILKNEEYFEICNNFLNKFNFYPDETNIYPLLINYENNFLDFNNIKFIKFILKLLMMINLVKINKKEIQSFLSKILMKIKKLFEIEEIKEELFLDLLSIKKNIYFILSHKINYALYIGINLDNIILTIKENNNYGKINYILEIFLCEIFDSDLNERNNINISFNNSINDLKINEYIILYYCLKIKILKNSNKDDILYYKHLLNQILIKISNFKIIELDKESELFILNFLLYYYKNYYQYLNEYEFLIIFKIIKYFIDSYDDITMPNIIIILIIKILGYLTYLEDFCKALFKKKTIFEYLLKNFYFNYNIYVFLRDNNSNNLKCHINILITYKYIQLFSNIFLIVDNESELLEENILKYKEFRDSIENCFENEIFFEKSEKIKFNCHIILINFGAKYSNIKIDVDKFFNFICQKCLEVNNLHFINKSLDFLINLLKLNRKYQVNFYENYIFFYFNLLNLKLNFDKTKIYKIFLILLDYIEFTIFWFHSFDNNNIMSCSPHYNKCNIIEKNYGWDKIIIDPEAINYNHFSVISISFWFFYNRNDFKNKFYTMIQNELGIGGLFVLNNNKEFGYFNENTGNFSLFGFNISDIKNDWNHIFIELSEINLKKSSNLVIYLNGRLIYESSIFMHTRIKYIGNSKDGKEKFFTFNNFRIYSMKFTEDEIIELSNFKQYIKYQQFKINNHIYLPNQNWKKLLFKYGNYKSELMNLSYYNKQIVYNYLYLWLKWTNDYKERGKLIKDKEILIIIYEFLMEKKDLRIKLLANLIIKNLK